MRNNVNSLVAKVRENPNRDCSEVTERVISGVRQEVASYKTQLLSHFVLILYDFDYSKCLRGITKCMTLQAENYKPPKELREKLLASLWFVIMQTYDDEGFHDVINHIKFLEKENTDHENKN